MWARRSGAATAASPPTNRRPHTQQRAAPLGVTRAVCVTEHNTPRSLKYVKCVLRGAAAEGICMCARTRAVARTEGAYCSLLARCHASGGGAETGMGSTTMRLSSRGWGLRVLTRSRHSIGCASLRAHAAWGALLPRPPQRTALKCRQSHAKGENAATWRRRAGPARVTSRRQQRANPARARSRSSARGVVTPRARTASPRACTGTSPHAASPDSFSSSVHRNVASRTCRGPSMLHGSSSPWAAHVRVCVCACGACGVTRPCLRVCVHVRARGHGAHAST